MNKAAPKASGTPRVVLVQPCKEARGSYSSSPSPAAAAAGNAAATATDAAEGSRASKKQKIPASKMAKVAPLDTAEGPLSPSRSGNGSFTPDSSPARRLSVDREKDRSSLVHFAQHGIRHLMQYTGWYDSPLAIGMRKALRGRSFATVAMVSLIIALFLSDVFITAQVPSNTALDVILTVVLVIFLVEFLGLSFTDPSYVLGFFFWMDLLGTASMLFDISFFLGEDATSVEKKSTDGGRENIIVVRAARATKLGARAGRLSRVLKILRFLPFIYGSEQEGQVKMAKVISNQLTNVLSTRVAFLAICIVIVLPVFGMFTYPETDDSMGAWTQLLAQNAAEYHQAINAAPPDPTRATFTQERFRSELVRFASFYSQVTYGPYKVCYGADTEEHSPNCELQQEGMLVPEWSTFSEPGRKSSIWQVSKGGFAAFFDLSTPKQYESVANMGLITFIIIVMVVFGLVTSSSIGVIALQPLERMLQNVRVHCTQIFKYTNELKDADDTQEPEEEDYDDTEQASEFKLLEKVVGKLAAIAHLSTTRNMPDVTDEMNENQIMVLNWMQGGQMPPVTRTSFHQQAMYRSMQAGGRSSDDSSCHDDEVRTPREEGLISSKLSSIPREIIDSLDTWFFNALDLPDEVPGHVVATYIVLSAEGSSVWTRSNVQESHLFKFMTAVESKYLKNPFHNFSHALDVLYAVAWFTKVVEAHCFLTEVSQFWLMVAAIGHDLGHLGVNNQYLVETSHELALKYNDRSPLENMHCARLFQVVSDPESNIFAQVEKDLYQEMRKGIITAILFTDVTKHNDMIKELCLLYQMNSEVFDQSEVTQQLHDLVASAGNTQLVLDAFLHCADVGNPMKPWDLCQLYAHLCLDEFFIQGDLERAAGIPVQMLNDRDKVNRPNSQVGFIEFVITPMAEAMVSLFPRLDGLAENLGENVTLWGDMWAEQQKPAPEAAAKMKKRVEKVAARCQMLLRAGKCDSVLISPCPATVGRPA